jgi:hypothetical protein
MDISPTWVLPANERLQAPRIRFIEVPESNQKYENDADSILYEHVVTNPEAQEIAKTQYLGSAPAAPTIEPVIAEIGTPNVINVTDGRNINK